MADNIILYHGTTHVFVEIDVRKGKPFKDFGQGFYLAETYERARNIALRNLRIEESRLKAMKNEKFLSAFVYSYKFALRDMDKLNVKRFASADHTWLKFVIANRMNQTNQHSYDIVIGPTADDDTRASIRAIMNAANGTVLSDAALNLLLEMLEPNNLPEQYYFGTDKAVAVLKLIERRELK